HHHLTDMLTQEMKHRRSHLTTLPRLPPHQRIHQPLLRPTKLSYRLIDIIGTGEIRAQPSKQIARINIALLLNNLTRRFLIAIIPDEGIERTNQQRIAIVVWEKLAVLMRRTA